MFEVTGDVLDPRPLVEFEREDAPAPRRYAGLPAAELTGMDEDSLARLWGHARPY